MPKKCLAAPVLVRSLVGVSVEGATRIAGIHLGRLGAHLAEEPDVLGDTVNAQISAIYVGGAVTLWDNISYAGELAGHLLAKVTQHGEQRDTSLNSFAYGGRGVITLDYYQVVPSLDLFVPIGIGYIFKGKSPTSGAFGNGVAACRKATIQHMRSRSTVAFKPLMQKSHLWPWA